MTPEAVVLSVMRAIPPGMPGKRRLASRLLKRRLSSAGEAEISTRWGRFSVPSLREPVAQALLLDGVYEPDVLHLLRRCLGAGGTFLDVGANVGCFTLPMAQHVGSNGHVLAVEASPAVFPYLARNVERNGYTNVTLAPVVAVRCDGGAVPFFTAPEDKFGMGTLSPLFNTSPVHVPARSLDSLVAEHGLGYVDAIKVDVEGHEADVFRGAQDLLTSVQAPTVVFEFLDWAEQHATGRAGEAQEVLLDLGFTLWRLEEYPAHQCVEPIRDGGPCSSLAAFIRPDPYLIITQPC